MEIFGLHETNATNYWTRQNQEYKNMENFKIEKKILNFQDSKIHRNGYFPDNYQNFHIGKFWKIIHFFTHRPTPSLNKV